MPAAATTAAVLAGAAAAVTSTRAPPSRRLRDLQLPAAAHAPLPTPQPGARALPRASGASLKIRLAHVLYLCFGRFARPAVAAAAGQCRLGRHTLGAQRAACARAGGWILLLPAPLVHASDAQAVDAQATPKPAPPLCSQTHTTSPLQARATPSIVTHATPLIPVVSTCGRYRCYITSPSPRPCDRIMCGIQRSLGCNIVKRMATHTSSY